MSNGDANRPHEITGDDVKPDAPPVPAEKVPQTDGEPEQHPAGPVPAPAPKEQDDEAH